MSAATTGGGEWGPRDANGGELVIREVSLKRIPMRVRSLPLLLCLAGCSASAPTDVVCTAVALPGVSVEVRDADTQAGLAAIARGAVTEGLFVDSLRAIGSSTTMQAAYERPGTYTVDVRATGYQPFTTVGVKVTKGECHVNTQTITVNLQKVRS